MEVYRGPPKRRADETAPQEIDDIDKDIVGSFNTEDVIETVGRRYAWVKEILNRLHAPPEEEDKERPRDRAHVHCSEKILQYCCSRGMVRKGEGRYKARCGLFGLPKSNMKLRIIFDCRPANAMIKTWGTFELFTLDDLLRAWSQACRWGKVHVLNLDFRHQFYQIRIGELLAQYMAIIGDNETQWFVPTIWTMGFHGAPRVGQCATWTIVVHREVDAPDLGLDEIVHKEEMPRYVMLRKQNKLVGYIFVLLDGICIIATSSTLLDQWQRRLTSNAKRFHMVIKMLERTIDKVVFAGVEMARGSNGEAVVRPAKRVFNMLTERSTHREVASSMGRLMWSWRVRQKALLAEERVLEGYKYARRGAEGWDRPANLPKEVNAAIEEACRCEATDEYTQLRSEDVRKWSETEIHYLATDATPTALGWCEMRDGKIVRECFNGKESPAAQVIRELEAVVDAAEQTCGENGKHVMLIVAVDADVVRRCITKGYSKSREIRVLLRRLFSVCPNIRCVRIDGVSNVADEVSRGRKIDAAKTELTWTALKAGRRELLG